MRAVMALVKIVITISLFLFLVSPSQAQDQNTVINNSNSGASKNITKTMTIEGIDASNNKIIEFGSRKVNDKWEEDDDDSSVKYSTHGFLDLTSLYIIVGFLIGLTALIALVLGILRKRKER